MGGGGIRRRGSVGGAPMTRLARAAVGTVLVSGSCLVGLALTEAALRLFFPRYEHAAEGRPDNHPTRIWARSADDRWQMRHPDTGLYHAFNQNSLALRHDRDFGAADLDAAVNVGLFGDSFTENYLLPSPYSLNEPLDFLLNTSGERFNVLNFGVSGYGTGQSFLRYEEFRPVRDLDYVFYLFTESDLENIYQTRLFYLDDAGGLRRREVVESSWWTGFASRFHVTYLLLDIRQRFDFLSRTAFFDRAAEHFLRFGAPGDWTLAVSRAWWLNEDEVANSFAVFKALVRQWRRAVEDAGGRFRVVVLPTPTSRRMPAVIGSEAGMIDLNECFRGYDATHANSRDDLQEQWRRSPYRFRNDGHWNEAGNQLAAVCLYRWLEQDANLPRLSEDGLREALYRYYAAFRGRETGWMPGGRWAKAVPVSPAEAAGIRRKYSAFDDQEGDIFNYGALRPDGATPGTLDRVGVDIRIDANRVVYTKAPPCRNDPGALFFLHVAPSDANDLAPERRWAGFDNLGIPDDFWRAERNLCVGDRRLPSYDIASLRTGQFDPRTGAERWEANFHGEP